MTATIVCLAEGWVVEKRPQCEGCYWRQEGSEKDVDWPAEPAYGCLPSDKGPPAKLTADSRG